MNERRASDFCHKLLLAVILPAEMRCSIQAVQALNMACAVDHLMEACPIVFSGFRKLFHHRKHDSVHGGLIISLIPFYMLNRHAFPLGVFRNNVFSGFISIC